jgi:ADP-dependent phosphofructokinase/glucokinase
MNLEDRSWEQLSVIHPDILVATEAGLTRCGELPCGQGGKPAHYIFEFTAGKPLGPIVLKRSSRTIVRFQEEHLDRDPDFERESVVAAEKAGAGILSGFNEIGPQKIDESLRQAVALAETWRKRGLKTIHLEIGDYGMAELRGKVLEALSGVISSLGMNYAELAGFPGENRDTVEKAFQIAEKLHLARLCVHSDTWALTITTGDPQREYQALLCGCLLAAVRAEKGYPCQPAEVPVQAEFRPLRWEKFRKKGAWTVVSCAAPFLERPVGTIGLGDTFLAGNLLVLGGTPGAKADVGAKTIL